MELRLYSRADNGPEFTAKVVRQWLGKLGVGTLFIEPGSPWGNGYIESFNSKLRDKLLNREISITLTEAKVLIEGWKMETTRYGPTALWGINRLPLRPFCSGIRIIKITIYSREIGSCIVQESQGNIRSLWLWCHMRRVLSLESFAFFVDADL